MNQPTVPDSALDEPWKLPAAGSTYTMPAPCAMGRCQRTARCEPGQCANVSQPASRIEFAGPEPAVFGVWLPMASAPMTGDDVLLLVPTLFGRRHGTIACQGCWFGAFWVIFNADAALQRVVPTHWTPLPPPPEPA